MPMGPKGLVSLVCTGAFDAMEQDTINLVEWHQLIKECGLLDGVTTVKIATKIFVQGDKDCLLVHAISLAVRAGPKR